MRTTIFLCVAVALIACATRVQPRSAAAAFASASDYYPLAVGNHWTYETNFLGEKRERRVQIIAERDGFFIDDQGAQLTVDGLGVRDQKRYLLREPIEVGSTWQNVVSASSTEHYKIMDVGSPCQAPAGSFSNCIRVESRSPMDQHRTLVNELTFAPAIGIVRIELTLEDEGKRLPQSVFALKEFKVKSKTGDRDR